MGFPLQVSREEQESSSSSFAPAPHIPDTQMLSFSADEAPIRSVVVFKNGKAEVTRVLNFCTTTATGLHEVELTGIPGNFWIDGRSVAVKGSGHCTILGVSFSTGFIADDETLDVKEQGKKIDKEVQALRDEFSALGRQAVRSQQMRELADRFVHRVTSAERAKIGRHGAGAEQLSSIDVDGVTKAIEWWAEKALQTDEDVHRLEIEGRRITEAIEKLAVDPDKLCKTTKAEEPRKQPAKVIVSLDVEEFGPIELEVKYMIHGASWLPAYDVRADTLTNSMSCTYYGSVSQWTPEDWEGVALSLSTAESTECGAPPSLAPKTVSIKQAPRVHTVPAPVGAAFSFSSQPTSGPGFGISQPPSGGLFGASSAGGGTPGVLFGLEPSAPPPPPVAKVAVAHVDGSGDGVGSALFSVKQPSTIVSNAFQRKKLTIGVFQLSTEVTHYIVPSQKPAAYVQAKSTNDTDYLLLASDNVSIFFDNSFVTKASLPSVSPGESFNTILSIDPAIKVKVAPIRKMNGKKSMFGKANQAEYAHSWSISNKKTVPVTCVVVDTVPCSTDAVIKISILQPAASSIRDSNAVTAEALAAEALEVYDDGRGGRTPAGDGGSTSDAAANVKTGVASVAKNPSNHVAWVVNIAPQGEVLVPLEYKMEWPIDKEIEIRE